MFSDKVGISNYFWSFKSAVGNKKRQRVDDLEEEAASKRQKKLVLEEEQGELDDTREETDDRTANLAEQEALQTEIAELDSKLAAFAASDPERVSELRANIQAALEGANRWTDNIFQARTYCRKNFGMEPKDFNTYFQIGADFDYLE